MEMEHEERFEEIEARLIAQEHRLFSVLQNFFIERKKWPIDDPRRDASAKALIWSIFFSPGTVAIAGATIGLATLAVLIWQNTLIKQQNDYFKEQNQYQQIQIEAQDKINTQTQRNDAIQSIYGPTYENNPRVKAEAVRSLVVIERSRIESGNNVFPSDYVNLHQANLENIHIENFDLKKVSFRESNLTGAALAGIDLTESAFRFANLRGSHFINSNLTSTFWDSANLENSDFSGANLKGANMVRANLGGADFSGVQNWKTIAFLNTNITDLRNPPEGFVEWAINNGAVIHDNKSIQPTANASAD